MSVLSVVLTAIVSFVSAMGGGSILFVRQNRRMKELEIESKQSDEWKKLYELSDADSKRKDNKIDELYTERQQLLERLIGKERHISSLIVYIERLLFARCDVDECGKRCPPRHYKAIINDKNKDYENEIPDNESARIDDDEHDRLQDKQMPADTGTGGRE